MMDGAENRPKAPQQAANSLAAQFYRMALTALLLVVLMQFLAEGSCCNELL